MALTRHMLIGLFLLLPATAWAESYLCVSDLSTGFYFHQGSNTWSNVQFTADEKFIVGREANSDNWVIRQIGFKYPIVDCANDFSDLGALDCHGGLNEFRMNKRNLRFLWVYAVGYWTNVVPGTPNEVLEEGSDTPRLTIGKCSPF